MKFIHIPTIVWAFLIGGLAFSACEKNKEILATWDVAGANSEMAHLRIVHAAPNFRLVTGQADSIHVFVNNVKVNGARLTYGGLFPAQTNNSYIGLKPGDVDLKISVGGVVNIDSIPVTTLKVKLDKGNFYSLIITDSIMNGSRDSAKMFMRDNFMLPNPGRVSLRLVHAMVDTADRRVDVWSARRNNVLYSNVLPGAIFSFSNQPFINIPDTLIVRRAGTTTELGRINNVTFADQRIYTLFLRGDVRLTSGAKARGITFYANR